MAEITLALLPPAPLHALELWAHAGVAARAAAIGVTLPAMGRSARGPGIVLIRFEPDVWWVEGDPAPLIETLGGDGALTAIGGGIARLRIAGPRWRTLLMEGGLFDAEAPAFAAGCCAATIVEHMPLRLFVETDTAAIAYVPASMAASLLAFWHGALAHVGVALGMP